MLKKAEQTCFLCSKDKLNWRASDLHYIKANLPLCADCERFASEPSVEPFLPPKDAPYNPPNFQDKEPAVESESSTAKIEPPKKEVTKYQLKRELFEREPGCDDD